jgi:hypothetical protein
MNSTSKTAEPEMRAIQNLTPNYDSSATTLVPKDPSAGNPMGLVSEEAGPMAPTKKKSFYQRHKVCVIISTIIFLILLGFAIAIIILVATYQDPSFGLGGFEKRENVDFLQIQGGQLQLNFDVTSNVNNDNIFAVKIDELKGKVSIREINLKRFI